MKASVQVHSTRGRFTLELTTADGDSHSTWSEDPAGFQRLLYGASDAVRQSALGIDVTPRPLPRPDVWQPVSVPRWVTVGLALVLAVAIAAGVTLWFLEAHRG